MSQKYIGQTLDIHGGGMENQFPHHECEIAQAESITGQPFARYWLHNNMCTLNGQKMGKSLGNAISLKEVFHDGHTLLQQTFEPVVVRHFILTSHYRTPLDFSNDALKAAETGTYKLRDATRELSRAAREAPEKPQSDKIRDSLTAIEQRFTDALNEDFNTAIGIATVFDFAKQAPASWIRDGAGQADLLAADTLMQRLVGDALGLKWDDAIGGGDDNARDDLIRLLVDSTKRGPQRQELPTRRPNPRPPRRHRRRTKRRPRRNHVVTPGVFGLSLEGGGHWLVVYRASRHANLKQLAGFIAHARAIRDAFEKR